MKIVEVMLLVCDCYSLETTRMKRVVHLLSLEVSIIRVWIAAHRVFS